MSFYVTLPSNSSPNLFPNNQPGHFFVKLPQTIDVTSQYEVGLVEIQFPNTYCNIHEDEVWIQYYEPKTGPDESVKDPIIIAITPGMYTSVDSIILALKRKILKAEIKAGKMGILTLHHNKTLRHSFFKLNERGAIVRISDKLQKILGFPFSEVDDNRHILKGDFSEIELDTDLTNVFVYCDLVAARPVGDVMVPLLRTVPILDKRAITVFRVYDKPHYVPLSRFAFDTIEILLTDDLGQKLPFLSGTSIVTLHFRTL